MSSRKSGSRKKVAVNAVAPATSEDKPGMFLNTIEGGGSPVKVLFAGWQQTGYMIRADLRRIRIAAQANISPLRQKALRSCALLAQNRLGMAEMAMKLAVEPLSHIECALRLAKYTYDSAETLAPSSKEKGRSQ